MAKLGKFIAPLATLGGGATGAFLGSAGGPAGAAQGAALGASLGGAAGGSISALTQKEPKMPQFKQAQQVPTIPQPGAIQRRLGLQPVNTQLLSQIDEATASLKSLPPEVQQVAGPPLFEAGILASLGVQPKGVA